jgi:hypothetical protein
MSAASSLLSIYHHYNGFICYSQRLLRRGISREAPRTCELISLLLVAAAAAFIFQIPPPIPPLTAQSRYNPRFPR